MDILLSGGPVLLAIVLLSLYAVYVFFYRFLRIRNERTDTAELMVKVNAAVRERDLELALAACEEHGGPAARVLGAALLKLPYGRPAVEAAFEEATIQEEQALSRGLRPLATIAQVAPMLGLLGTVTGMIISFGQISRFGTGDPSIVANGIGQALVTTAAGLIVAIPVIMGHAFLSSRVEAILVDIDRRREELMGNIAQAVASRREESQPAERAPAAPRPTPAGHAREDARGREDAGAGRALTPDPA
ncbi:MAG TPA: MotA/TolQ/ExbB proton channel family protein [Trueperaceae bacterium]|jgi:biopolymer transport protein ExbB|nr:MotA/TolQ/ExbB proton channel family protein [Trueperaceae bacterium]